jgi:hypothetical protein
MGGCVQEALFIQPEHNIFDGKVVAYITVIIMPKLQPQLTVSSPTGQSFCLQVEFPEYYLNTNSKVWPQTCR